MEDCFHLFEINKKVINFIQEVINLASVYENYIIEPTSENGEKIVKNIKALEENLEKVKENLVRIVDSIENDNDTISFKETEEGFKLE